MSFLQTHVYLTGIRGHINIYFLFIGIIFQMTFSSQITFAQTIPPKKIESGNLIIKIIGFNSEEGKCWFGLDNAEEIYESEDTVFIGKILPIVNGEVNLTIDSLAYGNYAIKVFYDENNNGELDTNFLGIPSEDYGYSNNASGWLGPPNWDDAKFSFNQKEMFIVLLVD
jgi:uncharacterized protein (DUF2141 family)